MARSPLGPTLAPAQQTRTTGFALGLALLLGLSPGAANAQAQNSDSAVAPPETGPTSCTTTAMQQAMLDAVNQARTQPRQCGSESFDAAAPLSWSCPLEAAARGHSQNMAELGFFSHTGPNGSQVSDRVDAQGYDWQEVGENIAAGHKSVDEAVSSWVGSPGHCANIMNAAFTQMGAARVDSPEKAYSPFWTQVFAQPR